ncbi:MAG: site-2 protease family protein [Cytophagales bacterium]|nr:site-2 protease family protein [Armatimonadota bacterium]
MSLPLPPSPSSGGKNSGGPNNKDNKLKPTEPAVRNAWSLRIATVSGIPIQLHFTFLLMIIWFAASSIATTGAGLVLFTLGLFTCVALHELGHALVAQRFGYTVRDIVLYPIGGVASIEQSPRARHELLIAIAGPAVNVVIALILTGILSATGQVPDFTQTQGGALAGFEKTPLRLLLYANIALVLFNMIPAFPMDGGRVLRALLALRLGKLRATRIAAGVGQFVAVLMGLYGLGIFGRPFANVPFFPAPGNFSLLIIALFVFFGASQELQAEQSQEMVEDAVVSEAMVREFTTLAPGDSLRRAAEVLLATSQQDFPVVLSEEVVGVLSRNQLLRGLAQEGDTAYVAGTMSRDIVFAGPNDDLEPVMMNPNGVQKAPVLVRGADGHLIGMVTMENLMEFMTLRQIARARDESERDRA